MRAWLGREVCIYFIFLLVRVSFKLVLILLIFKTCFFSGGSSLPVTRNQRVFQNGSLIMENIQKGDEGILTCTAKGRQGSIASGDIHLRVVGKFIYFILF